jgi:nicotinamidase-related amidase
MARRLELRARLNDALEIDPRRAAVLAIDTHRGHLDPEVATMPVHAEIAASVVGASARLLEATRAVGIPTVFVLMHNRRLRGASEFLRNPFWRAVEDLRERLTPELPSTIERHNLVGSVQTEVMPTLGPAEEDVVVTSKHRLSSFLGTDLEPTLRALDVDTLLLIGINTNTCVQCAAFEAFNRDYKVIVVSDCVDSMYGADLHELGLENVARALGWVLSVDEVVEKLGASSAVVSAAAEVSAGR